MISSFCTALYITFIILWGFLYFICHLIFFINTICLMNSCAGVSLNIHSFIHNIQITFIIYKLKIIIIIILKSTFNSELVITFFPQKLIDDQTLFCSVLFSRCISYISFHAYIHLRFKHAVRTCLCLSK